MRHKVTAIKDVIILAHIRKYPPGYDGPIVKPTESIGWVQVLASKPEDGLGQVLGVAPRFAPNKPTQNRDGFDYVPLAGAGDGYFTEHFGLFKIERSTLAD
jgi:hypothetical protein